MTIKELLEKYQGGGRSFRDAQNLAAEEIILRKIASSKMAESITLKGGIVMYKLTKNDRRVTQDIDFDLIRYSVGAESIEALIRKMNGVRDGFRISIIGAIEELHHEDYHGARVRIIISDKTNARLRLKLDIGVHTYAAIEQERIAFHFDAADEGILLKANPPDQICAEKLISLARLGVLSTRQKDLYDLFYLIRECGVSPSKTRQILKLFFANSKRKPHDIFELRTSIEDTLENERFAKEAAKPASKWIDVGFVELKEEIMNFVDLL